MGSSALLPMTSTKRQDFEMAHDALEQAFPAFLEQAPAQAVDALDAQRGALEVDGRRAGDQ